MKMMEDKADCCKRTQWVAAATWQPAENDELKREEEEEEGGKEGGREGGGGDKKLVVRDAERQ